MKNHNILSRQKTTALLAGILFLSLGTSFRVPEVENVPKRNDTVAYHKALSELEVHLLRTEVLDTDIEEFLEMFDAHRESMRKVNPSENESEADRAKNSSSPLLNAENGWYFLFD